MFHKSTKSLSLLLFWSLFFLENPLFSNTILVTNTDSDIGTTGSLGNAIYLAGDGDVIDCSPIAGQMISIDGMLLPALGRNFTSFSSSMTILGNGVILDGGGTHPVFSLAQGSANISNFTIQNGFSKGGNGGFGYTGGGGGTGGGGALYIHSNTIMTISTLSLNNNQAVGGAGGAGSSGGSGGGGGGYGGGNGGFAIATGANAGCAGGGGGNAGGAGGGRDGGVGSPNTFSNFGGAGGGGQRPFPPGAGNGGTNASNPATTGGIHGINDGSFVGGAGGGGGSVGSGSPGGDATSSADGVGGAGGFGLGPDWSYGVGGAGGGGSGGAAGYGASGGGGGLPGPGGNGGALGGGGGASGNSANGGNGGFGAGGGAGRTGGIDMYGLGGAGGSSSSAPAGGGGGSGLGGAIFIQKAGLLIIQDGVSLSGNSTTAGLGGAASGNSGGDGASFGQDIFIRSGGSLTFQINGALTLFNPIEGAGVLSDVTVPGITMSGMGTVSLNGANTYLGDTLIASGTLNLNGSISGDLQIEPSGTLSGNATINGSIYSSGTISPGNSIGQVLTTNLNLSSMNIYNVEINSLGQSDQIIASGFANVDGSVVVIPDDLITTQQTYTIISTGSGVTGKFSSLTSSDPAIMSLIYNPLTVELTYLPLNSIRLPSNAKNAAKCFVTLPFTSDSAAVSSALLFLSSDNIRKAFEEMSPAQFSGPTEIPLLDAILVRSTYTKHLQELRFQCDRSISFWIDGIAEWQNQQKQFGYRDTTLGTTIGIDYRVVRDLVLGLAFSYTHDHFHLKDPSSKANINSYYGGLYGRWNYEGFYMNAACIGAHNHYSTTRRLHFGAIDRHARSKHNGNEWLANFGFGYQVCPSRFQWTPYVNLDYVHQHEHSYTESGAKSLDLHVNAKKSALFQTEIGILLSKTYNAWSGEIEPILTLAYLNQSPLSSRNYHARFAHSSCRFTGRGANYERNLFAPRLALAYHSLCDRVNASIYYDTEVGSSYWAQDVGFDLTFRF